MCYKEAVLFACATVASAAPAAAPKDSRIALRYEHGQVLIVGGIIAVDGGANNELASILEKSPKLKQEVDITGASVFAISPSVWQRFKVETSTDWHIGEQWQLYPGAGPPATLAVEKVVIIGHPGLGDLYDGAIARFLSSAIADRIEGLRASEFLVIPGVGIKDVSEAPLIPLSSREDTALIRSTLFKLAREVVTDDNSGLVPNDPELERERIRHLNRLFLSTQESGVQVRALRWRLPGGKPLLMVHAIWYAENDGKPLPVFAGQAILEEGPSLKVLSFEHREGDWMRFSEFASWQWDFDQLSRFLNAWKIGTRYFLLRQLVGYETIGVELQELDPKQGLLETGLVYFFGL